MINEKIKEALKNNWGEKANALNCYAEVKLMDPISSWKCYIFAMDENEETVMCFIYSNTVGISMETLGYRELLGLYNEEGEHPIIDEEFRKIKLNELVRRLTCET